MEFRRESAFVPGTYLTMPQDTRGAIVGQASLFAIDSKTRKPQRP